MAHNNHSNHGNKHHGTKLNKLLDYLTPGKTLKGKDLYKAAKAEARITTKPQVDSYKRLAKQLEGEKRFEAKGLQRLGAKSTKAVSGVYQNVAKEAAANLAQQKAIGNQLVNNTANIGQASAQGLAQGQSTQLQGFLDQQKRQNAPQTSTATQQLAQVVANQQSMAQADQRAAQAFAGSQAAGSAALASNLGTSSALQGAAAIGGIQSAINSRIAESDLKYRQDIGEARGKAADARALKGSQIVQSLQQLRGQEQQFLLGKKATKQQAAASKLSAKTSIANSKRTAASSAASTAASIANSKRTAKTSRKNSRRTAQTSRKNSRRSSSGNNGSTHRQAKKARQADAKEVRHLTQQAIQQYGLKKVKQHQSAIEDQIRSKGTFGAHEVNFVARIVDNMLKKGGHKSGGGKGHKKPNPHAI